MLKKMLVYCVLAMLTLNIPLSSAEETPQGYTRAGSTQNVFFYGEEGYQVEYRYDYENKFHDKVTEYIDNYNQYLSGDDIDVYFYFVNNSRSLDFSSDMSQPNAIYTDLCDRLVCADQTACLDIDSFDTYKELFYQNDHHWNHQGAQKGYEDIICLLLGENEKAYQPVEEVVFDAIFNGSYSQRTGVYNSTQLFTTYRYDLPEITSTIEGKRKTIGRKEQYFKGKYSKDIKATHFATFYGGDYGEVVYDTGMTDKDNLLILCNSYGCSTRYLISRHFNKTYAVDMRHYMVQKGTGMRIERYLQENDIDKVLILGDVSLFLYGKFLH